MQEYFLRPPKPVIRVWHNHKVYTKTTYRNADIPKKTMIEGRITGNVSSYIKDGELFVNQTIAKEAYFHKKSPFLLECIISEQKHHFFNDVFVRPRWFVFSKKDDIFWLRLVKSDPVFHGYPSREGFELCPLLPQTPVRILINSKTWHSFSSRRATQYYECDYIYEYLGVFSEYQISTQASLQEQYLEGIKTINLRKELF